MGAFVVLLLIWEVCFSVVLYSWVYFVIGMFSLCVEPFICVFGALEVVMPLRVVWCMVHDRHYDIMPSLFLRDGMKARIDAMSACIVVILWLMVSCCLLSSPLMEARLM